MLVNEKTVRDVFLVVVFVLLFLCILMPNILINRSTNSAIIVVAPFTPVWSREDPQGTYTYNSDICHGNRRDTPIGGKDCYLSTVTDARKNGKIIDSFMVILIAMVVGPTYLISDLFPFISHKFCTLIVIASLIGHVASIHSYTYFYGSPFMVDNVSPVMVQNYTYNCENRTYSYNADGLFMLANYECRIVSNHEIDHSSFLSVFFVSCCGMFGFLAICLWVYNIYIEARAVNLP